MNFYSQVLDLSGVLFTWTFMQAVLARLELKCLPVVDTKKKEKKRIF